MIINKFQQGGLVDTAEYLIPVVGTYKSIKDAVNDPSLANIGMAGLSAISDVGMLLGVGTVGRGALGALKGAKAASKLVKASKTLRPQLLTKVSNSQRAAEIATKNLNRAQKLAVPSSQFAENQVYLKALGQQKNAALKSLNGLQKQLNRTTYLTTKSPFRYGLQEGFRQFPKTSLIAPMVSEATRAAGVEANRLNR